MKRIYNTLFVVVTLFAFASASFAQEPGEWSINGQINEPVVNPEPGQSSVKYLEWPKAAENGLQQPEGTDFAYSKDISSPQSDGTYWIKLESFSTGAATRILSSTPSDIILVLDSSSSMSMNNYGTGEVVYTARNNGQATAYSYSGYGNNTYYYYFDGDYRAVSRGRTSNSSNNAVRYLTFSANGVTYYLYGTAEQTTPPTGPTGRNADDTTIWTGVLYTRTTTQAPTRLRALQDATIEFIEEIYNNDEEVTSQDASFAGNRIAIITYDNNAYTLTSAGTWVRDGTASWFDIGASGAKTTLENAVNSIDTHNWTRPDLGMAEAISDLLSGNTEATMKRPNANLTVVMFTDGVPCHSTGSGNTFEAADANAAIFQGHRLKADYEATLFTVGLLDTNSTSNEIRRGVYFLDLLSSNYPDSNIAQNSTSTWNINGNTITVNGLTVGDKESEDYFQLVDDDTDLSSIFKAISKQSGGSSSHLSAASRNVDVVSNSFIIPAEPNETEEQIAAKVKIFIAKVTGYDTTNNKFIFAEEILKGHLPDNPQDVINGYYYYPLDENGNIIEPKVLTKADNGVSVAYNATTKAVTVTGFDYSSMFCGPVYEQNYTPGTGVDSEHIDHYQGFKIIIMIPIEMNPDAVGGPDVNTNGAGSGIFIQAEGNESLVTFKSPTVSLPVNIHIKKTGLGAGESAKFRIDRAQLPENNPNVDPSTLSGWSYVSTVFVTRPQGSADTDPDPVVNVRGLPANMDVEENGSTVHRSFVYRITEEPWSWSYVPETPAQYTNTANVTNPFTFTNRKKDNIDVKVRHAESKATNVFKTGVSIRYDDSKPNDRSEDIPSSK